MHTQYSKAYSQIFLVLAVITIIGLLIWQYPMYKQIFERQTETAQPSGPITDHYTITANDNSKTFTYPLTSRFTVLLDKTQYPPEKLIWNPDVILGKISNVQAETSNEFPIRFEAAQPGTAVMQNGDFSVTIIVTAQ